MVLLTRLQYKASGEPHHSQRHKLRMDRFVECTIEAGGMESQSSEEPSADVFLSMLRKICFQNVLSNLSHSSLTCRRLRHFICVIV